MKRPTITVGLTKAFHYVLRKLEFANSPGNMLLVYRKNIQAALVDEETEDGDGTVTVASPLLEFGVREPYIH